MRYTAVMPRTSTLPLFHLYGDPPDDQAFDFIHVETISSRSSIHDWTIRAHRHRNLFQILLIVRGGGEMTFETQIIPFEAPAAIIVPATIAHGFRFRPDATEGWVLTFTEDVARALSERSGEAIASVYIPQDLERDLMGGRRPQVVVFFNKQFFTPGNVASGAA